MKKEEGTKDWIFKFTTALGSVLADMIAGTEQPKPIKNGIKLLP